MATQPATRAPRGTYSSPRQEARQRRILEAAREEISSVGYDAITMQALAEAAGVSTKTLYNLYGTKDELLLVAVADLLGNLEQQDAVLQAEPGIPRLLAFTDSACTQIVLTPRYAEVMARSLFRAPAGHNLVDVLLGNTLRVTGRALAAERDAGGFREPVDIAALADVLAGCQWGLVLMWSKGLVALEDIRRRSRQSQLLTLLPLCVEARRRRLEQDWGWVTP
jgi:AcrR family transcriptional regulator